MLRAVVMKIFIYRYKTQHMKLASWSLWSSCDCASSR